MAIGHFMMAFEPLFLLALFVLILGNGAFKPNISTQVGGLYAPGDPRRDRAFSIFYVGINLGAFFSPLVCGTLGEAYGWHYGFAAAGIGMLIGTLIYVAGWSTLPQDHRSLHAGQPKVPLDRDEWRRILALALLFVPVALFWATYEQQGNTIALWADTHTDRHVNLLIWQGQIPVTWFQAFNPFMIFAFTPFVIALWALAGASRPRAVNRYEDGARLLRRYARQSRARCSRRGRPASGKASWLWLLLYFAIITIGELYLSPIGLSLVTKVAPARVISMVMGMWLATSFAGNFIGGWLGSFWTAMDKGQFFLLIAAVAAFAGATIVAFNRPLQPMLKAT